MISCAELAGISDDSEKSGASSRAFSSQFSECRTRCDATSPRKRHVENRELKEKTPLKPKWFERGFRFAIRFGPVTYLSLKSSCQNPSSHSSVTFRHPSGTCGYG